MNPPDNTLSAAGSSDEVARLRVELLQKNRELQSLQEEIEETNRGVVALYAELDEQAELLKRSERKFQTIYAEAPSGIALIDDAGRIVDNNTALSSLLGMAEGTILKGRQLSEFVPRDFEPRVAEFSSPVPMSLKAQEIPVKRLDGSLAYVEWRVSSQIEPGVTLVVATDVSQRVELEQRRVQWLERERAARGEAEQGNRMKDDFISVLAHELRTPLNAVMGWSQVLRKGTTPDVVARASEAIDRNCATQARMIADLLDMSRLNMGKLAMSFEPVDPLKEVTAAVDAMKLSIEQKAIEVTLLANESYRHVRADASRLQQVIWNLMSNAIKFSPHGGRITVSLREDETGVRIRIADTGQGISADFLPRVFDRFAQSDAPSNRHRGGLGLGLAIVKQIVDAHNGTISVHSDGPGRGTWFELWLPVDRSLSSKQGADAADAGQIGQEGVDYPLQGLTLLVVDDDPDAVSALRIILSDQGAHVLSAQSAQEAVNVLSNIHPDVLISDIGMPDRDGYELVRQVRHLEAMTADPALPERRLPAIALTSFTRDQDREQARLAGFDALCPKPLKPLTLLREILSVTGRQ